MDRQSRTAGQASSIAVVGPAGENGGGAIDLLGEHDPRQGVRPGRRTEGQALGGGGQDLFIEPIGAADGEGEVVGSLVAQPGEKPRKSARGDGAAAFIAGDEADATRAGEDGFAFRRLAGLAGRQFDNLHRAETAGPSGSGRAGGVVAGERGFGGGAQPADTEETELQTVARWREVTAQIFSML